MATSTRAFTGRNHQLAAEIGRRIVSGQYPPGSVLPPEAQLLAEFGLSRPVLREAIKLLESKGMLQARQRVGTTITERSGWNMLDADVLGWIAQSGADPEMLIRLTDVRMIVEPGACLLAARDGSDEAIDRIDQAYQSMVTHVDDPQLFVQADRDFHLALMAACRNEYLAAVGTAISAALMVSLQRMNPIPISNRASLLLHKPVVDALKKRDGRAAARASMHQLDDAFRRLRSEEPPKKTVATLRRPARR
jgi:GntR family galactonate operon transcriptional repressor